MRAPALVFDIGSSSAKAAIIADGEVLRSASAEYATRFGAAGLVEQDAGDWWDAVKRVSIDLRAPAELSGIVLTGQMQDVILLDNDGAPVRPVMLYSDTRAVAQIERIHELVSPADLAAVTGIEQSAGSLLAKLRWLREHEAGSLERASRLAFGAADYIGACMTGNVATDATTASTTGLWNLSAHALLSDELLERLELGWLRPLLPAVVPGGARIGELSELAAAALQLPAAIPVYLGPGDAGAATIGAGCGEPGPAYAYVGTSGWVGFSALEIGQAAAGVLTLAHPRPGRYIQVAPMMTSAGNLDWLQSIFSERGHEEIIHEALERQPGSLLFLPYLHGERAPFDDPFARGAYIGISASTTGADLWRALLEGLAFAYRHTLSALSPQPPEKLTLIGGGARNTALNQLFADIIGLPVHLPPDAENAGLHGALRAVDVMIGFSDNYAIDPAPQTQVLRPDRRHHELYQRKYQHFLAAYPALKPLFRQLAS
ncbi:MAG: hypothetical protein F4X02_17365 [Chloroflexi bacterium]|nr:hypothetical protein [Chloroflexota bacterium]